MITLQCCLFQTKPSSCRVRGGAGRPQTLKVGDRPYHRLLYFLVSVLTEGASVAPTHVLKLLL